MFYEKIKLFVLIAALTFAGLAMVACETETPVAEDTRIIIDGAGREVVVPKKVERVIVASQPTSTLVFSVGGQDKIVAIDKQSQPVPYFSILRPDIKDLPEIGYRKAGLNMEVIAAIEPKPEVVFMFSGSESEPAVQQLSELGIAAIVVDTETPEALRATTLMMGELLDREDQAKAIIAYYDNTIKTIDEKLNAAGYPYEKRKTIHIFDGKGLLSAPPGDYYQSFLAEAAGGISASKSLSGNGFKTVSAEELAQWNPDFIFATEFFNGDLREEIDLHKGLSNITAIQEGNVYRIPGGMEKWDYPAAHSALGMWFIAKLTYPDVFADFDLHAEVENYYKEFYGKSFTELNGKLDPYLVPFSEKLPREY